MLSFWWLWHGNKKMINVKKVQWHSQSMDLCPFSPSLHTGSTQWGHMVNVVCFSDFVTCTEMDFWFSCDSSKVESCLFSAFLCVWSIVRCRVQSLSCQSSWIWTCVIDENENAHCFGCGSHYNAKITDGHNDTCNGAKMEKNCASSCDHKAGVHNCHHFGCHNSAVKKEKTDLMQFCCILCVIVAIMLELRCARSLLRDRSCLVLAASPTVDNSGWRAEMALWVVLKKSVFGCVFWQKTVK